MIRNPLILIKKEEDKKMKTRDAYTQTTKAFQGEQLLLPFPSENEIRDRPVFRGIQLQIPFENAILV